MQVQNLLFIGLMILAFYFLLIRPQQRRQRQQQELVSSVEAGDEVLTIGGIFGRVRSVDDAVVWLEVADGTVIKLTKSAIGRKIWEEDAEDKETDGAAGPDE